MACLKFSRISPTNCESDITILSNYTLCYETNKKDVLNDNDAIHIFTYATDDLYVQFKKRDKWCWITDIRMHFYAKVSVINLKKFVIIAIFVTS